MSKETPLMKQYWEIKSLHQDKILLFRMGDFFEMFFDDAVKAAPILGIALTQRNKKSADETPMCGMPHHSIAGPINKLLAHGLKVAICDQIEDPKMAKGLVKRAVTRVLTPGVVYDSDTLDATAPHYLCSLDHESMSFVDMTTGEAFYFKIKTLEDRKKILDIVNVAEFVVASDFDFLVPQGQSQSAILSRHDQVVEQKSYPLILDQTAPQSAARLLSYIAQLAGEESLKTISALSERSWLERMQISATVLRHLEIFSTYRGEILGSLYHAINRTKTSSGARLLRQWISFPLQNQKEIETRQNKVQGWISDLAKLKRVREILAQMGDIERRLGKISNANCNGRDLQALSQSLMAGVQALEFSQQSGLSAAETKKILDLIHRIDRTLLDEQPLTTRQGYMIKNGVSVELDEYIELSTQSHNLVQKLEAREREATGISSLKVRYNNVFGYYIEITNTHKDKAPSHYSRKQTLANAERYCTDELVELERKVLSAQSRRNELEYEIYEQLRKAVLQDVSYLMKLAHESSELDIYTSLAWLALEERYVKPQFSSRLKLKASRHPVVEQFARKNFVANDIELSEAGCLLLTGPNMAGKSTIMRQVALTVVLAQMGSFVPADQAELPIFDAIYTRIGASDMLTEGLSTFMVEMVETADMLNRATARSLVVLDEVGRGTSTYDGMCLAQSILEFLLSDRRCMTFFATHYHELTSLEQSYRQIVNAHMKVADRGGEIKFLHTLTSGPALKSYGVHVAQIAGLPDVVVRRAKSLLKEVESQGLKSTTQMSLFGEATQNDLDSDFESSAQDIDPRVQKLVEAVKSFPLVQRSPLEAMQAIKEWQDNY